MCVCVHVRVCMHVACVCACECVCTCECMCACSGDCHYKWGFLVILFASSDTCTWGLQNLSTYRMMKCLHFHVNFLESNSVANLLCF